MSLKHLAFLALGLGFGVGMSGLGMLAADEASPTSAAESAASTAWLTETISEVPVEEEELVRRFQETRFLCLPMPAQQPLEVGEFKAENTFSLRGPQDGNGPREKLRCKYCRIEALSLGLDMMKRDREVLPLFSSGIIQRHLDSEYISIQAVVLRDPRNEGVYLSHQPYAAIAHYGDQRQTYAVTEQSEASAKEFRGLGIYLKPGTEPAPAELRTLVAINRAVMVVGEKNGKPQTRPFYELVFVRMRMEGDEPRLHAFGTSHERGWLHYLEPLDEPTNASECSVKSLLIFTEYKLAGQVPVTNATRDADYRGRAFTVESLDAYAKEQGWEGNAFENLNATLDAIIDDQLADRQLPLGSK